MGFFKNKNPYPETEEHIASMNRLSDAEFLNLIGVVREAIRKDGGRHMIKSLKKNKVDPEKSIDAMNERLERMAEKKLKMKY